MRKKIFCTIIVFIIISIIGGIFFIKYKGQIVKAELWALKYPGQIELNYSQKINEELKRCEKITGEQEKKIWWYLLKITNNDDITYFQFNESSYLFDSQNKTILKTTPELKNILEQNLKVIEENNPFGTLMEWEEVEKIFPKMTKAKVRDLETGLTFFIQRRAGSKHADVQPLKASDTEIFKEIYGGKWSWKRKAVILEKDGYKVAASINGMPHGLGAIQGNNFPGHFCMHFLNTKTHTGNVNLAHQLMVWKAAGLLEEYLINRNPEEMVEIVLTAIGQNDPQVLLSSCVLGENITPLLEYMDKIAGLKIQSINKGELENEFIVKIEWYEVESGKKFEQKVVLIVEQVENQCLVNPSGLILDIVLNKMNK